MRKLILIAACALAAAALPSLAGAGAFHGSETFTETFTTFGPDPCVEQGRDGHSQPSPGPRASSTRPAAGRTSAIDFSGKRRPLRGKWASGPWDPQPGAFVGTWTYEGHTSDQAPPSFKGAVTGVTSGPLALADGRVLPTPGHRSTSRSTKRVSRRRSSSPTASARAARWRWALGSVRHSAAAALATLAAAAGAAWATNAPVRTARSSSVVTSTSGGRRAPSSPRTPTARASGRSRGRERLVWTQARLVTRRQEDRVRAFDWAARRAHLHRQRQRNRSQIGRRVHRQLRRAGGARVVSGRRRSLSRAAARGTSRSGSSASTARTSAG